MLLRCQGQVRSAGMGGATGLDMGVALRVAEIAGADPAVMIELLPAAEAGMVAGYAKRGNDGGA